MSDGPPAPGPEFREAPHCRACGAANDPSAPACWRCHQVHWHESIGHWPYTAPQATSRETREMATTRGRSANPWAVIWLAATMVGLVVLTITAFDARWPISLVLVPLMVPLSFWGFFQGNRVSRDAAFMGNVQYVLFVTAYMLFVFAFVISILGLLGLALMVALFLVCAARCV